MPNKCIFFQTQKESFEVSWFQSWPKKSWFSFFPKSSSPNYCYSLYTGISQASLSRLQPVQNAAARLLTGTWKRDHISPILASLHWLPVHFRIDFKVLLFVFKALNGQAASYIRDLLTPYSTSRSLRSADLGLLAVPRSKLKLRGDWAFAVAAPILWNSIPLSIRSAPSIDFFKSRLKTYFYSSAFGSSWCGLICAYVLVVSYLCAVYWCLRGCFFVCF